MPEKKTETPVIESTKELEAIKAYSKRLNRESFTKSQQWLHFFKSCLSFAFFSTFSPAL